MAISSFWWLSVLLLSTGDSETEGRILLISALMGAFSVTALIGTIKGFGQISTKAVLLAWGGTFPLLVVSAATFLNLGLTYIPSVVLLLIGSSLAMIRHPWRPKGGHWIELTLGLVAGISGTAISSILLLTQNTWAPANNSNIEQYGTTVPFILQSVHPIFRFIMGSMSLMVLFSLGLYAWSGNRTALAITWGISGGLLLGAVVGFFLGGLVYLPTAIFALAGAMAATLRGVPERRK